MSSSLTLPNNSEPFLDQTVTYNKKWILYDNQRWPAQWLDWEEASKHFPKPTLHQKRPRSMCSSLCPSYPLQLFESWWNHYIWEVCSANWWDALKPTMSAAGIVQQQGPNSSAQQHSTTCHKTNASKVEWIGLQSFASSTIFTWSLTNQLPLLQGSWQFFLQGEHFHN